MPTKLKVARILNDMRQCDLAELTGIPQSRISEYENGKREAPPEVLERIASVIPGVTINDLLGEYK